MLDKIEKRFLDVNELSQYLGVRSKTVYSWVNQRTIPYVKIGRLLRFDLGQIDEWIKENSIAVYDVK